MKETLITTHKLNPLIDPHLHIWGGEVAAYLFLGGLVAGILVSASYLLLKKENSLFYLSYKLPLWAPLLLILGMFFLFLDLEYKSHLFRFYTTFQITSPMSWGAWILLFAYPASFYLLLLTLPKGYPSLWQKGLKYLGQETGEKLHQWAEKHKRKYLLLCLSIGAALGLYTGILLSDYVARPFWNTPLLPPLFLISGISTALALASLLTTSKEEGHLYGTLDAYAIGLELLLLFFFLLHFLSSEAIFQNSLYLILGGELTPTFWVGFVFLGLFFPLLIEIGGQGEFPTWKLASFFVLFGGFVFRYVLLQAGQLSQWIPY